MSKKDPKELAKQLVEMAVAAENRENGCDIAYIWNRKSLVSAGPDSLLVEDLLLAAEALDRMPEPAEPGPFDGDARIERVDGTLTFQDGSQHQFSIADDGQWQQWGAETRALGRSSEAIEDASSALLLAGHLQGPLEDDPFDEGEEDPERVDMAPCAGCEDSENAPHAFDCSEAPNSWNGVR